MDSKKALEVAKPLFKKYGVDKLFLTRDSQVFFVENHAWNHARSLDKSEPKVFPVTSDQAAAKTAEAETSKSEKDKTGKAGAKDKAPAE